MPRVRPAAKDGESVSYLPILPPRWASLPQDPVLYGEPKPFDEAPMVLTINADSACMCKTKYVAGGLLEERSCTVFGLTQPYMQHIQLQSCPNCPPTRRRFVGPDCRELGVFNYNNHQLFTHELLDEYTSAYTSSETPFTAWVSVVSRRYSSRHSSLPFVSEQVFRSVWFAYVRLQALDNDMRCPKCGPTPEDTIWDGVTLAFSRKHLLPSLCPPTISSSYSPARSSGYVSRQQILDSPSPHRRGHNVARKLLRKVVVGRSLILQDHELKEMDELTKEADVETDDEGEAPIPNTSKTTLTAKASAELLARIKAIPQATEELNKINVHVAALFTSFYGGQALLRKQEVPAPYRRLFTQVRVHKTRSKCLSLNDSHGYSESLPRMNLFSNLPRDQLWQTSRNSTAIRQDTMLHRW